MHIHIPVYIFWQAAGSLSLKFKINLFSALKLIYRAI